MPSKLLLTLIALAGFGAATWSEDKPLPKRLPWTTSRLTGTLTPPPPYRTERIFPDLTFANPVTIAHFPGKNWLLVMELSGKIFLFPDDPTAKDPHLLVNLAEITGHWRSYGLAFHPQFARNRQVFLCYVLKAGHPKGTRVSRFLVSDTDPPRIDLKTEQILLEWPSGGHNGGCLAFGQDGFLYISTGDGSDPNPPDGKNTGQDISDLLAAILRIDVDRAASGRPYDTPKDNPFVNFPGARPEVWAFGLRNPWKMTFHPRSGELWVGDVGWETWENIFRVERGGNYGWSLFEGRQPVRPDSKRGPTPVTPPVVDHPHTEARSITGGRFYHGKRLPELDGAYIYGDYVTGRFWGLRHDGQKVTWHQELAESQLMVIDFGVGREGELYILDYRGSINRLVPNVSAQKNPDFPKKLSETGLFTSVRQQEPASGVVPYAINAEPWTDHAKAERFFAMPGTPTLPTYPKSNLQAGIVKGAWIYPNDTVFAKTMSLEMERGNSATRRRLETQVLHRNGEDWNAYNYIWNDEQTDAFLAGPEATERTFTIKDAATPTGQRRQTWRFASRTECLICHTTRAGSILGFQVPQLHRGEQLTTLRRQGFFEEPLPDLLPRLATPFDEQAPLADRARAYLHTNCAHCHRQGGGGTAAFELVHEHELKRLNLVDSLPAQGTFGLREARNVASGDPYRSVLYYRMAKLGRGRMPHLGANLVDERGLDLIHSWITSLAPGSDSHTESRKELLQQLRGKGDFKSAVGRLLESTGGALALLRVLDTENEKLPDSVRTELIDQAVTQAIVHADPHVRDLFERFVPEEKRTKRLGTHVVANDLLALPGNRERGQRVFIQQGQCKNCHRINKDGTEVGPDLSLIGKKLDRAKLLESILEPSKTIEPAYVPYLLETKDGAVHTGMIVRRNEAEIVLRDAQGKVLTFAMATVEAMAAQRTSLMPEQLLRDLTAQEAADLLEFLQSLK